MLDAVLVQDEYIQPGALRVVGLVLRTRPGNGSSKFN